MTNIPAFSLKCKRREILIRIATNVTLSKMSSFFFSSLFVGWDWGGVGGWGGCGDGGLGDSAC